MRVLLSTCSFQDTPGPHHALLEAQGWDVVCERGPLSEVRMLEIAGELCIYTNKQIEVVEV